MPDFSVRLYQLPSLLIDSSLTRQLFDHRLSGVRTVEEYNTSSTQLLTQYSDYNVREAQMFSNGKR